ncbi:MAG TPA: [FeFe] hydrogenase H-cluster radical SAM maturase HydG [Syntrophales bacterium]|nr:[FeFe] hydrogenase H-cluster radical SAM maturase HydG [Syntrophales bacterium]HPQ43793.1 [FeFe] hydrogenase H-cluster radical SAM maturase HydG [Syntrophales bacterium]
MSENFAYDSLERNWIEGVIREDEIDRYLIDGEDFIDDQKIWETIGSNKDPDPQRVREIIRKSLSIETLDPDETAALLNVTDKDLWNEIFEAAGEVKRKVYDNRIVTFAPLYCSNYCVNNCLYCGFRRENRIEKRRRLTLEEVRDEARVLAGEIGHKRLIAVYGEHPLSDAHYIADTIRAIYDVTVKTKNGYGQIRRVNINAAPMSIGDLEMLREVGIGTYQVFQETYHHDTYRRLHPAGTLKANYRWRLYTLHRAIEAGVDDVAIGALFGLYDWRFEVMGLLCHARDLERHFNGLGPHTISFPRLEPAAGTPFTRKPQYRISDEDFKRLVAVIRLAVPYTGMIITARERAEIRREVIPLGCTQTDASTRIGIGAYSDRYDEQEAERQQFILGDTRNLDEVIGELAEDGYITSFCTAGYRCGRTGDHIMQLLKCGREAQFCKLNAVLTFREWLDDFASEQTKRAGEKIICKEMDEIKGQIPAAYSKLVEYYKRIEDGERDLYF